MQFFSLQERSDLVTSYKLTEQQNPRIAFHWHGKNAAFCIFQPCFSLKNIKSTLLSNTVETENCIIFTFADTKPSIEAYTKTQLVHISSALETVGKKFSSHCCLAYMFNIDLISHLIPNTLIIYLFERLFTFTTMHTLKQVTE